jgi:hypothetical protein
VVSEESAFVLSRNFQTTLDFGRSQLRDERAGLRIWEFPFLVLNAGRVLP